MFKSSKPKAKTVRKVACYLELKVSSIVRLIDQKGYDFEEYVGFRERRFSM
jgi:hypothetical protein